MSTFYRVTMSAIYTTPATIPNCTAILEFPEPQGNDDAARVRAGYIAEIAFTESLERRDVKKLSYEAEPIEEPVLNKEPNREIEGVKVWLSSVSQ